MITHTPVNIAALRIAPKKAATLSADDILFDGLRTLMADCGSNKNDRAIAVITALVSDGIDTSNRIVPAMRQLGFNTQHVGRMLSLHTGDDPARHYWRRETNGVYTLLQPEERVAA